MLAGITVNMNKLARRADKPNPRLAEYLKRNGLSFKKITEISDEQIEAERADGQLLRKLFYSSGLDAFQESVEYSLNMETFGMMAEMLHSGARVFEPCCMSGYLGAWLASSVKGIDYVGMDIDPIAIAKAKELAYGNVVNPACFTEGDYRANSTRYDVVVGRKITNCGNSDIDIDAIKKICSLADELIVLHFTYDNRAEITASNLGHFYASYGFVFEQASEPFKTATGENGAVAFVYRAFKKPEAY
jgi:hypothetical protein